MIWYIDPAYLVLVVVIIIISAVAQMFIRNTYAEWDHVPNGAGLTGTDVGKRLVAGADFDGVSGDETGITFDVIEGELSDNFDPRTTTVNLSTGVANRATVAAMAVAAHEVGHAQQHAEGTIAMRTRSFLVPAVTVSPSLSYLLLLLGFIFNNDTLLGLGIIVFGVMVLFSVATLPVEFGASRRALGMLDQTGVMAADERAGARRVLLAAGLTYVASAVASILTLLYYLSIVRRDR